MTIRIECRCGTRLKVDDKLARLTGAYTQLLRGNGIHDCCLGIVLVGFVANGIWSIIKAAKLMSDGDGSAGSI